MVIAHVITRLLRAGSEENTIATCLGQARDGHRTLLIHGREWNPAHRVRCGKEVELICVPELVHEIRPLKDLAAIRSLHSIFRDARPTVVHTHQSKAGILGRVAARLANVPVIVHGVHIVPFDNVGRLERLVYLSAERAMAQVTHAFINVSEGTRQTCLEHAVGRVDQHFVAYSGMDLSRFQHASWPEDWRKVLGLPPEAPRPPVVLMLAALEKRKRHLEFLDAFVSVVSRVPDVRLLLAGEGPMRAEVEARVARDDLRRNVRLLGFDAHPERLIALADLTVLTSIREGLPRVVVQSLAAGRPVVTSALPGIHELVRDGVNGVVTPAGDLQVAADAIAGLLADRRWLGALQAGAASTDVSGWSTDSMCRQISGIYERFVGTSSGVVVPV